MIVVRIPGNPQPQGRGRSVPTSRGRRVMDPERSRSWKGAAQVHMVHAMRGLEPLPGALLVAIVAVFACPKGDHRKVPRPVRWCAIGKGDWDNLGKPVCDAGNGILWRDDAQVSAGGVLRVIGAQGDVPRVEVAAARLTSAGPTSIGARDLAMALLAVFAPQDWAREGFTPEGRP